jgi:hypothetical protein
MALYLAVFTHIVNSLHKFFWTTNHTTKAQTMELRNANANSIKSHEFLPTDMTITVALSAFLSFSLGATVRDLTCPLFQFLGIFRFSFLG